MVLDQNLRPEEINNESKLNKAIKIIIKKVLNDYDLETKLPHEEINLEEALINVSNFDKYEAAISLGS